MVKNLKNFSGDSRVAGKKFSKRFTFNVLRSTGAGFTIIEMIVAAFIFSIIMVAAVGATLSIVRANQQAEAVKSVVSNFSYALESMVRNIRVGSDYRCGGTSSPYNCTVWAGGTPTGSSSMTFTDYSGNPSGYRLNGTVIQKRVDATNYIDITSPDAVVDRLTFFVDGNGSDNEQPSVVIIVRGHIDFGSNKASFSVETWPRRGRLIAQKQYDSQIS